MNISAYTFRLQSILKDSKSVLIILSSQSTLDEVAAGTGLYLSLLQRGKQATIASPQTATIMQSDLVAVDKIITDIGKGGKNLVISFPYEEGAVEKVSYTIENNRFNVVIEPKSHGQLLNKDQLEYTYKGDGAPEYDVIFILGAASYEDLGTFATIHKKLLEQKFTVVIHNKSGQNPQFGKMPIINVPGGSISEVIALLLSRMNLPMDQDVCTNLLKGIKDNTQNFSQNVTADTFEAAAVCTRKQAPPANNYPMGSMGDPFSMGNPQAYPQYEDTARQAPPDWLKPKVFRSSNQNIPVNQNKGTVL